MVPGDVRPQVPRVQRFVKMRNGAGASVANFAIPSARFAVHTEEASHLRARIEHMRDVPWPSRE